MEQQIATGSGQDHGSERKKTTNPGKCALSYIPVGSIPTSTCKGPCLTRHFCLKLAIHCLRVRLPLLVFVLLSGIWIAMEATRRHAVAILNITQHKPSSSQTMEAQLGGPGNPMASRRQKQARRSLKFQQCALSCHSRQAHSSANMQPAGLPLSKPAAAGREGKHLMI